MTVRVRGGDIVFNDGSTQSTAASIPTTLYAIGTYIIGRPNNFTAYGVNSVIGGSSLYSTDTFNRYVPGPYSTGAFSLGSSHVNVGSWRCVSPAWNASIGDGYYVGNPGLWVRYA
jgi:hypothetical protein